MKVLALDGSPAGSGRTATAAHAVLAGTQEAGAETSLVSLSTPGGIDAALAELGQCDAFVFATPIYRASYATPMKALLDRLPRGMWGETSAPLEGRAVAIVATGATLHHFLGLQDLRHVLAAFFAAHVLPPGLYVPGEGFDEAKQLLPDYAAAATLTGRALVEQARALASSPSLSGLRPQA